MVRLKTIIKRVISYILALIFAVIFALYFNANVGWYMLIALILAPVMSVILAWITSKAIFITYHMEECVMSKGEKCHMEINVQNKSIFPTTPIELIVLNGEGVKSKEKSVLCSVAPCICCRSRTDKNYRLFGTSVV